MVGVTLPEYPATRQRVLIIVQNLPVPFDRRVWLECKALMAADYDVTVVCPKGKGDPRESTIDGVRLLKYRPYAPGGGALGFIIEYAYSFLATALLVLRARRAGRFDVLQACNPPDIFWPIARWLRRRDGTRFVFDHHDLCPELYDSRFPGGSRLARRGLVALERATFRTANHVVSTNFSYAEVAVRRGGKDQTDVTVVRTGPDGKRLARGTPVPALRRGRAHLVAYIGVMGPQDGVDLAVRAAAHVVHDLGRKDVSFTFMGSGDSYADLVVLRDRLDLEDYVELPGRVPDHVVLDVLSTADRRALPGPEEPAQRRLHHEQDHGVHGLRAAGGRLRPQGDASLGRRCRGLHQQRRRGRVREGDRRSPRRRRAPGDDGSDRTAKDRAKSSAGLTSARRTSASTTP